MANDAPTADELLVGVLTEMDHNARDNAGWTEEGFPDLAYLSAALGRDVTREDVLRVDPTGYPRTPVTVADDKTTANSESAIATAPPQKPVEPPINVEALKAQRKTLETRVGVALAAEKKAKAERQALETQLDAVVGKLERSGKSSLAEMQQKMFAANDQAAADRNAQLAKFRETTGGVIPSKYPSKLDEHSANKRGLIRRASRMGLAAGK